MEGHKQAAGQGNIGLNAQVDAAADKVAGMATLHGGQGLERFGILRDRPSEEAEVTIRQAFAHDHHGVDAAIGLQIGGAAVIRQSNRGSHTEKQG